ncbi:hypothetical protein AJ80_09118 [Polytolypa hystricis UAMH7299]|uniref:Zn(2)-C6 fungal-type domain-containing protein n=1 Tax=Polytolypa hystricis (strain UAMH7299) TaxID=1447883 RepID=A0A2B7WVN5_POLH7|nr:hypothetical protein AJ80_09118 [Polytolypa hystricis UAMH7299]
MPDLVPPKKRRLACDRCSSLKLRCPKVEGNEVCTRCLRASAACIFSPSIRGQRPHGRERPSTHDLDPNGAVPNASNEWITDLHAGQRDLVMGDAAEPYFPTAFSWDDSAPGLNAELPLNSFSLDGFIPESGGFRLPTPPRYSSLNGNGALRNVDFPQAVYSDRQAQMGDSNEHAAVVEPTGSHDLCRDDATSSAKNTTLDPMYQLAELSGKLAEHSSTIPKLCIYESTDAYIKALREKGISVDMEAVRNGISLPPLFSISITFQLTQSLIDIYPKFGCSSLYHELPSLDPIKSTTTDNPSPSSTDESSTTGSTSPRDSKPRKQFCHANVLLMLSCYHRAFDIWEAIFTHIKKNIERGTFYGLRTGEISMCQKLHIGSFVPVTKVPMEIVLAIEFMKHLSDQLDSLNEAVASANLGMAGAIGYSTSGPAATDPMMQATNGVTTATSVKAKYVLDMASGVRRMLEEANSKWDRSGLALPGGQGSGDFIGTEDNSFPPVT